MEYTLSYSIDLQPDRFDDRHPENNDGGQREPGGAEVSNART
jgi:hypothetical protein